MQIYLKEKEEDSSGLSPLLVILGYYTLASSSFLPALEGATLYLQVKPETSAEELETVIQEIIEKKEIDKNRIYAIGEGRGACLLWDILGLFPDLFTAAVLFGGYSAGKMLRQNSYTAVRAFLLEDQIPETMEETGVYPADTLIRLLQSGGNQDARLIHTGLKSQDFRTSEVLCQLLEGEKIYSWLYSKDKTSVCKCRWIKSGVWEFLDSTGSAFYVSEGEQTSYIIDTGLAPFSLTEEVRKVTRLPLCLLLTHGHHDHMRHSDELSRIFLSPKDLDLVKMQKGRVPDTVIERLLFSQPIEGDGYLPFTDIQMETVALPGHTPGSVLFLDHTHQVIFTGDAIGSGQVVLLNLSPFLKISEYRKNLLHAYQKIRPYSDYQMLGGHPTQQGGYAYGTIYNPSRQNPLCIEVVEDFIILCDRLLSGNQQIEDIPFSNFFCHAASCRAVYRRAEMIFRREQIDGQ